MSDAVHWSRVAGGRKIRRGAGSGWDTVRLEETRRGKSRGDGLKKLLRDTGGLAPPHVIWHAIRHAIRHVIRPVIW